MHDLDELDELAHHVDRMQSLLSDRHPGLSTWVEALCEHWQAVADIAEGRISFLVEGTGLRSLESTGSMAYQVEARRSDTIRDCIW